MECIDYGGNDIRSIRGKFPNPLLHKSLSKVSNYYKILNMVSESGGKSGSFIFVTTDEQLVIKTITKSEFLSFKDKLIKTYSERILNNESSRLVRIFALLHLKSLDQYVIIMENLIYKKEESIIFDLKGSKVGRMIKDISDPKHPPKGLALKDINFEEFEFKVSLKSEARDLMVQFLIEDFKVLKDCGIMDYSLLLLIRKGEICEDESRLSFVDLNGYVVTIGVIDLFQEYSFSKQGEKAVKSLFNDPKEVSSVNPEMYFLRISSYLKRIFN